MITDLATLRAALATGHLPPAIAQADPSKLQRISAELTLVIREGKEAIETVDRIRQTLIDFGALDPVDKVTGIADLLDVLLPPQGS